MATFVPRVTLQQSLDGTTVLMTDVSNYTGTDEGVTLANIGARNYVITDGDGTAITSGIFTPGSLTKTFALASDAYLHVALSFVLASSAVRTNTVNYLAENYYNSAMIVKALKLNCGCKGGLCDNVMKSFITLSASEFYFNYGYAVNSQTLIEASNTYINS